MDQKAEGLKAQRTREKTNVTTAAKRLTGAIEREVGRDCIKQFMFDLEKAMADFQIVQDSYCHIVESDASLEQFRVVNGLDLVQYEASVKTVYNNASAKFNEYKCANPEAVKNVSLTLMTKLETYKQRLHDLCRKTEEVLGSRELHSAPVLQGLCQQFDPYVDVLLDLTSQLSVVLKTEQLSSVTESVNKLISKADCVKVDCSIAIQRYASRAPQVYSEGLSYGGEHAGSFSMSPRPSDNSDHELSRKGNSDIRFERIKLPEFSGHRKDWPEFKAVWKQMAEAAISNKSTLAYELKRSLKGSAQECVRNVYITKPEAYDIMWTRLSEIYDDVSAGVDAALETLKKLKAVRDGDYKGLVSLVNTVESAHAQLEELGQLDVISAREIDTISELLPSSTRMEWIRSYHKFDVAEKVRPLKEFMKFLTFERACVARLAEHQKGKKSYGSDTYTASLVGKSQRVVSKCVIHKGDNVKHATSECKDFLAMSLDERFAALKAAHVCFRCFGPHRRDHCKTKISCDKCKSTSHNALTCKQGASKPENVSGSSHVAKVPSSVSLYAILPAYISSAGKHANVFCDNGSNTSYITHKAAEKLNARKLDKYTLDITTMGNVNREYDTALYEFSIRTVSGEIVPVLAFGIDQITGPVSTLNLECLSRIFPDRDVSVFQRRSKDVDILIGCDYYRLHPKHEVCAKENLSIMQGELGLCVVGSHTGLQEGTELDCNMVKVVHDYKVKVSSNFVLQKQFLSPDLGFIVGEELATSSDPKCGGCRCGKCPTVGHTFSFKEEQELKLIQDNLRYNEKEQCWYTRYPWLADPSLLPDNYHVALATLRNTERTLAKDPQLASKYKEQIVDMVDRQAARKLSSEELKSWEGPKFYISHLAVSNPKSHSTPVRIVFNSSQKCQGVSLNQTLAKGPDCYLNNLIGLLLRWREGQVAVVGDIKKMFHSVKLETVEQHCHRFLWRDLDILRDPDVYVMLRVNMGDTPAPAICTEAIYKTAEMFEEECPGAALVLKKSTYVDDIVDSFPDLHSAKSMAEAVESILSKGGFHIKCWLFSGEVGVDSQLKSEGEITRVLGIDWNSKHDLIVFKAALNFSQKRKGERTGPNLGLQDVPHAVPSVLTRRIILEQVMSMYDPLGLLSPFTFIAKMYLRETWTLKLDWDDAIPQDMYLKWIQFFTMLFQLDGLQWERKLCPEDADGDPWLVLLSDGSDHAYGFAAYVRWRRLDGTIWCRLIMAKCRIAPVRKLSTPQMELNAALLAARGRKVIEREMRFTFGKVLHLVDSETVLNMINKTSTRFKVYEGVRIGEIQAASNGDMSEWAWLPGAQNVADWLTRGRQPCELGPDSEWYKGPSVLYKDFKDWEIKFGSQSDDTLPGEKQLASVLATISSEVGLEIDYARYSSYKKVCWVVARLLSIAHSKSFRGGNVLNITAELLQAAEQLVLKDVQRSCVPELQKSKGQYHNFAPVLMPDGIWVVGRRLMSSNPMTPEGEAQVLLPAEHVVTRLIMREAHVASGHRGRDATLARFRRKYWVPHGSKLAWSAKNACQMCKLRDAQFLKQEMGELPDARVKQCAPFTNVMLDIFGPFPVRGEVQKRTTGKSYGVIFTDMSMRAVHIEGVFGYDTDSFLLAFSRFVSVRGWPSKVYSDPGSQLVCVEKELRGAWALLDQGQVSRKGAENGLTWIFGPADASWYQGAVESLIKSVKRAFSFAFHAKRFSASEFLSACYEIANLLNERPIGTLPSADAEISILTPNCLLLGRATAQNPGGWQPRENRLLERFQLVQTISNLFWQRWNELWAPGLVVQQKWHTSCRNLKPGDVVVVADRNTLRGDYRIGLIKSVFPDRVGKVRRVTLTYKNFKVGEKVNVYSGTPDTEITRSVHKLSLLVPVD